MKPPKARRELADLISVDPEVMHGTPCFRGTRVPLQLLLDDLKNGYTIDEFLAGCPTVKREQVPEVQPGRVIHGYPSPAPKAG